jgi:hypothetical protein
MRGSAISFMTQASVALKDSFLGFFRSIHPHDVTKAGEIQFNLEQAGFELRHQPVGRKTAVMDAMVHWLQT